MSRPRTTWTGLGLACGLAALALASSAFAQTLPRIVFDGPHEFSEGSNGITEVELEYTFQPVPQTEVSFRVATAETDPPEARAWEDFSPIPSERIVVPAGQASGRITLQLYGDTEPEDSERFLVRLSEFDGVQAGDGQPDTMAVVVTILDDDAGLLQPLVGRDDYVSFRINRNVDFHPGENDVEGGSDSFKGSIMTVVEAPRHGQLEQFDYGTGIDRFRYTPAQDFGGRDHFRYRLCTFDGSQCVFATVFLQGMLDDPLARGSGRSHGFEHEFHDPPRLDDARFVPSSLAYGREVTLHMGVDDTPHLAWDSTQGMSWTMGTLPASAAGETVEHRIFAKSRAPLRESIDLRIGIDRNGDGRPSEDEEACLASAVNDFYSECDALFEVGEQPVDYWVAMHSREPSPQQSTFDVYSMRMDDPGSLLKVTGPAVSLREVPLRLQVSWVDPAAVGRLASYVRVMDGDTLVSEFRLEASGGMGMLMLPVNGGEASVDLVPTSWTLSDQEGFFFDVPLDARSLTLTAETDKPVAVALYWAFSGRFEEPTVGFSIRRPPYPQMMQVVPGTPRTIRIDDPREGRWFAVVQNETDDVSRLTLKVDVDASIPSLRAGSYYNTEQPGHGLLIYPAGDQWAGLWYTYDDRAQPTWYYLQAPRPVGGGVWRAPLFRNAWNGTAARQTQVGEMQITPLGQQRFIMSYMLHGQPGSQIMDALGSGCPTRNGQALDISSHWFDPARAGNGYSVQTWADGYQFIAAFTYDAIGYPLFLAAERADLGGDTADMPLERLTGKCPTCAYSAPSRHPAGVLRRIISGDTLARIEMDVDFSREWLLPARHTFSVADNVQLLGGPGTTQGCAP